MSRELIDVDKQCGDVSAGRHPSHTWRADYQGDDYVYWCDGGDPGVKRPDAGQSRAEQEIRGWWRALAQKDADAVVPKAVEYSAYDLDIMGHALLAWSGQEWGANGGRGGADAQERSAIGQEMAIAYYVLGKVSRLIGAYHEGRLPSNDTWDDIRIYATMAARVRETGRWGL